MLKKIIIFALVLACGTPLAQGHLVDGGNSGHTHSTNSSVSTGGGEGDLSSTNFKIKVCEFSPGGCDLIDSSGDAGQTVKNTLQKTIERLIIALGTIALLVMIIGAGLMILYTGEDERLTNGKTIFTAGLIAVAIALLSGLMVQLVAFLLYI